jgi:asparagine synthase (glutamine-hydrolysing)
VEKGKGEQQWADEIRAAFLDAGHRQMVSDVPIALSLSSGIDSGALLAAMDQSNNHPVDCFTVGFDGGEKTNEAKEARVTASHFHSRFHYKQIRSSDYVKFFQKYMWHLEEPIENASSAAYYFVAKMARDAGIKVLFNGQGADEVFGGYPRYFGEKFASLYKHLPSLFRRRVIWPAVASLRRNERLKRSVYSLGEEDELRRFLKIYTITPPEWKRRLIRSFGWSHGMIHEQALSYLEKELSLIPSGDSLWRMLCLDVRTQLADNLLLCEDKMSMAASVEARVHFLDREFMDLAYRIPSWLKIRGLTTKYILRRSLGPLLPPEIIRRPKRGFPNPMEVWIRKELGYLIKDFFQEPDSLANTIFNRTFLQHVLDQHERGRQDYKRFLFLYVCLELWAMAFLRAKM